MKKFFTAAVLAITVATSAFATDANKINAVIMSSFKSEFKTASNVTWNLRDDYAKADFVLDSKKMEVFYNQSGEKIALSKSISPDDLPVNAKRDFAKRFEGFTVKEAISIQFPEEGAYFISGENEKESVILKVTTYGNVSVYNRTAKQ